MRLGLELGGWLLESYDVEDPSQGKSVSALLLAAEFVPSPRTPWFLRIGAGRSGLTDEAPDAAGGSGGAWLAAAGYEFVLGPRVGLTESIGRSGGKLGSSADPFRVETERTYSVWDARAGVNWHSGAPKR